ncbi:MAG: UbiX family flavin prenyltransferase [Thermoplasmata archaeon]|nr:UbiX family flavin prenyltransferase [Thermoplasmata archaeon]
MNADAPLVIGISGASGAPIAVAALRALHAAKVSVLLVVSRGGEAVLKEEAGLGVSDLAPYVTATYDPSDIAAPIASGSRPTRGMAIVPCSSNTVAQVALGLGDNLLTRAAHVHLKERRTLVLVPRETPLSTLDLRHLATLSELGVVVLDAAPPYYLGIERLSEAAEYLAGKLLDQFGVPHRLYRGWKEGT